MKPTSPQTDPVVIEHLDSLRELTARGEQAAAEGRVAFLAQAEKHAQAVSRPQKQRLMYWNFKFKDLFQRKERFSMISTLVTIFTVLALTFGGASATVFAAQGSLPGEALYQLKIQSEDFRLTWENQETEQIGLALEFANRRIEEMQAMLKQGQTPAESLLLRFQNHLNSAFRLAAGLEDASLEPALDQIRQTLEQQERTMAQLKEDAGTPEDAILLRIRDQIQLHLNWTDEGLADPSAFRNQFGPGGTNFTPPADDLTPGFGPGPFITGTPTPGSSYGPGLGLQATCTCTPQSDQGPQPDTGNSYGPGTQPTTEPGNSDRPGSQPTTEPGDGYGPGPQPTTQPEDGSGPGAQPVDPENGGGGSGSGNQP
jgi:hypothetical protein